MERIRLISQNKVNIESILSDWLSSNTFSSMFSEDEVFTKKIEGKNSKITIFIAEDYYFRISSTLTVTVIVEEAADKTTVDIVSSGGKMGLFGISRGAEESAVLRIVELLEENGFKWFDSD